MTLEEAIKRERLSDELRAIQFMNVAQQPDETYEQNLERRALSLRQREILSELAW
jgi:hypothetical protein